MWLLRTETAHELAQGHHAVHALTSQQQASFSARVAAVEDNALRALKLSSDVAEISVHGTLTPKPDIIAHFFGGGNTTYPEIIAALARAQTDPAVKRIVLDVNSPGGQMSGLYDVLVALEAMTKPVSVMASQACSAAYALAAVAGKIEAKNAASEFGSIGVATRLLVESDVVHVTNSASPKKRPDPRTPEGKGAVQEYLDDVFELFADAIARGRHVPKAKVKGAYGSGATVLAEQAKRLGMIDSIAQAAIGQRRAASGSQAFASRSPTQSSGGVDDHVADLVEKMMRSPIRPCD